MSPTHLDTALNIAQIVLAVVGLSIVVLSSAHANPRTCGQLNPDQAAWDVHLTIHANPDGTIVKASIAPADPAFPIAAPGHPRAVRAARLMIGECRHSVPRGPADFDVIFRG